MIKSYVWRDRGGWSYIVCCCLSPVSVEETAPFASERDSVNQSINQFILSHTNSVSSSNKIANTFRLCVTGSAQGA